MKKVKDKVKKKRIRWADCIYQINNNHIISDYMSFRSVRPNMSLNRCAYNVLKTYYSTTAMRYLKKIYENTSMDLSECLEWLDWNLKVCNL